MNKCDYLIVGAGIIGMAMADVIKRKEPDALVVIIDKEDDVAFHASRRNSGVLHAGFYYTADSLKARFTIEGNQRWKHFCYENDLAVNACGKLVVAKGEEELETLFDLELRGKQNGSTVEIIDEAQAREIEPNVKTFRRALWSPDTASINPEEVCAAFYKKVEKLGVQFHLETAFIRHYGSVVETTSGPYEVGRLINCAGLYADKIAHDYGFGKKYTMIPFKGLYLKYTKNKTDVGINIYPVPNLKNPFLGVHYTKTVDGTIKIGPTAIPAFWRENYEGMEGFVWREFSEIVSDEMILFFTNAFGFRDLAFDEMKKYNRKNFVKLAQDMVQEIDPEGFTEYTEPGIRAQLLDRVTNNLVQDFAIEGDEDSIHILNAVSPAFTCALPFADFVYDVYFT